MLTASIIYGRFGYREEIEFEEIRKDSIYGNIYCVLHEVS